MNHIKMRAASCKIDGLSATAHCQFLNLQFTIQMFKQRLSLPFVLQLSRCLAAACTVLLGAYVELHGRQASLMVRRSVAATPWLHHKVGLGLGCQFKRALWYCYCCACVRAC